LRRGAIGRDPMGNLLRRWQLVSFVALAACTSSVKKPQISEAATELALSTAARQKGDYRTALKYAQKAVASNPEMAGAHFAVGRIADDMCFPDAQPGPNMRECNVAIEEYKRVLQIEGSDKEASKDLAFLLWRFGREESEVYYRKALALDPNDPDALAAIAAINASRSWKEVVLGKVHAGVSTETPLISFSGCSEIRQNNLTRVNEGISFLTKALQIKSDNVEFMAWLSELYMTRAEIQCDNPQGYRADIADAGKWDNAGEARRWIGGDNSLHRYPPAPPPKPREK
jgi:tetratricopeptide (TPR) repeat protein